MRGITYGLRITKVRCSTRRKTEFSRVPADFRWHIDLLENLSGRSKHPVLRARLSDLCALLDRKRGKMGFVALSSYLEIIERVETGEFQFRFEETSNTLSRHSAELLRRTLQLRRILGWDTPSKKSPSSGSTVSMLPSIIAAGPAF
jgi:hypothetical protein